MKAQLTKMEDWLRLTDLPEPVFHQVGIRPTVDLIIEILEWYREEQRTCTCDGFFAEDVTGVA